jgi:hypothetical protein
MASAVLLPGWIAAFWLTASLGASLIVVVALLAMILACRDGLDATSAAVFFLIEAVCFRVGALNLVYPPQDLEFLRSGVDVRGLLFSYALWGPRFCLSYPATFIRDQFNLSLNHAYACLCVLVMGVVVVLSVHAADAFYELKRTRWVIQAGIVVFWGITLCFMNGRLVNCFCGMLLVLISQGRALRRGRLGPTDVLLQAVGVYLTMMSSGTMWVSLAQCCSGDLVLACWFRSWRGLPWLAAMLAGYAPFFLEAQQKNLSFFGGRVMAMLNHGWGAVFHLDDVLTLLLLTTLLLVVGGILRLAWRKYREMAGDCLLWLNIPIAVMGGAFGYSTGTMVIPAALLLSVAGAMGILAGERILARNPGVMLVRRPVGLRAADIPNSSVYAHVPRI